MSIDVLANSRKFYSSDIISFDFPSLCFRRGSLRGEQCHKEDSGF